MMDRRGADYPSGHPGHLPSQGEARGKAAGHLQKARGGEGEGRGPYPRTRGGKEKGNIASCT